MPSGPRIRANNVYGVTTDNPLVAGAVVFNSNQLVFLPTVASAHAVITLDPLRQFGDPEIVIVTVHTAASTIATITRGAYGTLARNHPQGTVWVHAATNEDVIPILTSSTRPSDPYRGERIFETDTNRFVARSTADVWQQDGLFFDPPACRVFRNTTQSITNNTLTPIQFNAERYDTDSMHDTVTNNTRITMNTAGLYLVTATVEFAGDNDYIDIILNFKVNGTTEIAYTRDLNPGTNGSVRLHSLATAYKFAAGDYVECIVFQANTSAGGNNINSTANRSPEFSATWIGRGN